MTGWGKVNSKLRRKNRAQDEVYIVRIIPVKEKNQAGLVQMTGEKIVEKPERMGWRRNRDLESKPNKSFSSAGLFLKLVSTRGKAASGTSEARRKEVGFFYPASRK